MRTSAIPKTAIAISPATRATALLTPDATPACCVSTAVIAVVVSGATTIAIANPSTAMAGKNVVQYEAPIPGFAYSASPTAATIGPMVNGTLLPILATRPPDHRDSKNIRVGKGRNAAPAAVAV